ncbi:zinc-binding alcohol dehydrogenase family protein [Aspergillus ibericus CBS 121593]|uniref:Putative alcohol dehydrogenase n=1 Tax=Aspergillus ibericus CBS 121593 TaxID=1448316 RepID=A0A395GYU0_9EURO|nr:putative alcohol dehydrogenase [Aspergillus ibericus CBS 121593]RAL00782.1 putative alcohol dehydrogenase [Aspergillus ibericus CBS 121593]
MSFPQSFKAAIVPEPKAQNVISDRTLGPLKDDEVVIEILATAINPVDWKMRDYNAFITEYPAILGSDAAGRVVAVGSAVSGFAIGDRVFFQGIIGTYDSSTFQQYCKMPAALVAKTPDNISDEQAAGISLATMAAVTAFYDKEGYGLIPPWEKGGTEAGRGHAIVILGGASSVGQYAIQLARLSGFENVITNASSANFDLLRKLGAHVVLDRHQADAGSFAEAVQDTPLMFVFDAISVKATQILGVQILQATRTANSHVVTVHTVHPETTDQEAVALGQTHEFKVGIKQVLGVGSAPHLRYLSEPLARNLGEYIAKGQFIPNRTRVVPGGLTAVEQALSLNKEGVSGEKVVFCPSQE